MTPALPEVPGVGGLRTPDLLYDRGTVNLLTTNDGGGSSNWNVTSLRYEDQDSCPDHVLLLRFDLGILSLETFPNGRIFVRSYMSVCSSVPSPLFMSRPRRVANGTETDLFQGNGAYTCCCV